MSPQKFDMSDYVSVDERIGLLRERYPDASLQPANPLEPFRIVEIGGRTFVAYAAACYRTPDDPRPGIGVAWEPFPGPTPYTKDSELQNAETSAWGRAIVAALAADTKRGVASAEEVRARGVDVTPTPATLSDEALAILLERLNDYLDKVGRYPQEWMDEGLPDRPHLPTMYASREEQAHSILDDAFAGLEVDESR